MYKDKKISVVVPAYNSILLSSEKEIIEFVLTVDFLLASIEFADN